LASGRLTTDVQTAAGEGPDIAVEGTELVADEEVDAGVLISTIQMAAQACRALPRPLQRQRQLARLRLRRLGATPLDHRPRVCQERRVGAGSMKSGYEIDPLTVSIVRRIFTEYDRGVSLRKLAASLDRDGILPPRHVLTGSTTWGLTTVRQILTEKAQPGVGQALRYRSGVPIPTRPTLSCSTDN
jgi:hypothetical protein